MLSGAAAVLVWLANDTERVRQAIETVVSEAGGRPFSIEGEFDFELGRVISLRAERIRWRDPVSDLSPDTLQVEEFTGSFDLLSLLLGTLEITEVRAEHAILRADWDEGGPSGWAFGRGGKAMPGGEEAALPWPRVIHKAVVHNLSLHLRHPALTDELVLQLRDTVQQQDGSGRLSFSSTAVLEDRRLAIGGHLGPFPDATGNTPVPFDLKVSGPLASLDAEGSFNWPEPARNMRLQAALQAPNAMDLVQGLKLPLQTQGDVRLDVQLLQDPEDLQVVVEGAFGEYRVDAKVHSDDAESLQRLDLAILSRGPSLRGLAVLAGLPPLPDAPYELELRAKRDGLDVDLQRLRLDTTGLKLTGSGVSRELAGARDLDLHLAAEGADFAHLAGLFELDVEAHLPFALKLAVTGNGPGKSDSLDVAFRLGGSNIRVQGSISESVDFTGSRLRFELDAPNAAELGDMVGIGLPTGAALTLQGTGSVTAGRFILEELTAAFGEARLKGSVWLERGSGLRGPQQEWNGGLSISGNSLMELLVPDWRRDAVDTAFDLQGAYRLSADGIRFQGLTYRDRQLHVAGDLDLVGDGDSRLEFDLTANADSLRGLLPDLNAYRPADVPVQASVRGNSDFSAIEFEQSQFRLGEATLDLTGQLQLRPDLRFRLDSLKANGPRLSELGRIGPWELTDRPFRISASGRGGVDEQFLEELSFESGENNLQGRLSYRVGDGLPTVELALSSSLLDLDEIRRAPSVANPPNEDEPNEAGAVAPALDDGLLFSREALPFEWLERFNGSLQLDVASVISHRRHWRNLAADASLQQGVLTLRRFRVDAAEGKVNLSGVVKPAAQGRSIAADITAEHAMISLKDMSGEEIEQLPHHAVSAQLSASGRSPHELAASLDGYLWIVGGSGQVKRGKLGPLAGDFLTELVGAVIPFAQKKPYARVDCQGLYLEIADGKAETAPAVVIQTEHAAIVATGTVDLHSEAINFVFETTPRKGIGVSLSDYASPFTKIAGTLKEPKIILNPKGALVEGGAAVATVGVSVLVKGLVKRWLGSRQICRKMADQALTIRKEKGAGRVPDLERLIAGSQKPGTEPWGEPVAEERGEAEKPLLEATEDW